MDHQKHLNASLSPPAPLPYAQPSEKKCVNVENLLSEKLLAGWVLMQQCCPTCDSPLIKCRDDPLPADKLVPPLTAMPLCATIATAKIATALIPHKSIVAATAASAEVNAAEEEKKAEKIDLTNLPPVQGVVVAQATPHAILAAKKMQASLARAEELNRLLEEEEQDDVFSFVELVKKESKLSTAESPSNRALSPKAFQIPETPTMYARPEVIGLPFCVQCNTYILVEEKDLWRANDLRSTTGVNIEHPIINAIDSYGPTSFEWSSNPSAHFSADAYKTQDSVHTKVVPMVSQEDSAPSGVTSDKDLPPETSPVNEMRGTAEIFNVYSNELDDTAMNNSAPTGYTQNTYDQSVHVQEKEKDFPNPPPDLPDVNDPNRNVDENEKDIYDLGYDEKRTIATKILGAKMLQGFTLKETQCDVCGMPIMENSSGVLECVVCPVLAKKAAKKRKKALKKEKKQTMEAAAQKQQQQEEIQHEQMQAEDAAEVGPDFRRSEPSYIELPVILSPPIYTPDRAVRSSTPTLMSLPLPLEEMQSIPLHLPPSPSYNRASAVAPEPVVFPEPAVAPEPVHAPPPMIVPPPVVKRPVYSSRPAPAPEPVPAPIPEPLPVVPQGPVDWNFLREKGRATMTQKMMEGWIMLSKQCVGDQCGCMPLMSSSTGSNAQTFCVICLGSGNGEDGSYIQAAKEGIIPLISAKMKPSTVVFVQPDLEPEPLVIRSPAPAVVSPTPEVTAPPEQVAKKTIDTSSTKPSDKIATQNLSKEERQNVSKEIGRRMVAGWNLLDIPCPKCVMPLMSKGEHTPNECVQCGPINEESNLPVKHVGVRDEAAEAKIIAKKEEEVDYQATLKRQENAPFAARARAQAALIAKEKLQKLKMEEDQRKREEDEIKEKERAKKEEEQREKEKAEARQSLTIEVDHNGGGEQYMGDSNFAISPNPSLSIYAGARLVDGWTLQPSIAPCAVCNNVLMSPPSDPQYIQCVNEDCQLFRKHTLSNNNVDADTQVDKWSRSDAYPERDDEEFTAPAPPTPRRRSSSINSERRTRTRSRSNNSRRRSNSKSRMGAPPSPHHHGLPAAPSPHRGENGPLSPPKNSRRSLGSNAPALPPRPMGAASPPVHTGSTRGSSIDRRRRGRSASPRPPNPSPYGMMWDNNNSPADDKPPRFIVGDHDDTSVMSEGLQSQARTVASDALGAILERIDRAKSDMIAGQEKGDMDQQMEMAKLIDTLANAAQAVKKLEDFP